LPQTHPLSNRPLGKRALLNFVVESFRDMQKEIYKAERDISRRRSGKRRARRGKSSVNEDDSPEDEDDLIVDELAPPEE
jgi:hypothetical protein